MTIDRNTSPYYDDFSPTGGFHQILFKPGYPVQARELTQSQSILRDQIAKFGDHIFKHGSVVIPGNSIADLATPYILLNTQYNSLDLNLSLFDNVRIVGVTSGIKAIVRKTVPSTITDPTTFYISYVTGGGTGATNTYSENEEIYVEANPLVRATLFATSAIGLGSLAVVNDGVYYIKGSFVSISKQSVVISKYDSLPSCHVLLKIVESIIDSTSDISLLDPAQGVYNYAAPGADRLKIELILTVLPLSTTLTDEYVEIMRYDNGDLKEHSRYAQYSELEKSLARRTFDEAGDYLVNGFDFTLRENAKTLYNNGLYPGGNVDQFVIQVTPGKGYIEGLEVEVLGNSTLSVDKARTAAHIKARSVSLPIAYGRYIYVSDLKTLPNFNQRQTVNLFNTYDPTNGAATNIGTLRVVGIDYFVGDPSTPNAIYKLYVDQLTMNAGVSIAEIGGLTFGSGGSATVLSRVSVPSASHDFSLGEIVSISGGTRTGTIKRYDRNSGDAYIYRHDITRVTPVAGDLIVGSSASVPTASIVSLENIAGSTNPPIFKLPIVALKSFKNILTNNFDITYSVWRYITINTNSSGYGTFTITDGTIRSPEVGITVAATGTGIVTLDKLSVSSSNTLVITGGPASSVVNILTQVDKVGIQPKVKTLTSLTLSAITPTTVISLTKPDIYRIVSIFSNGLDVTDSYQLDNGQTDYTYNIGKLNLVKSLPLSPLTIMLEYFAHTGTSDYFCIDSYSSLGADYITRVPTYGSKTTAQLYNLGKCIDFRPTAGTSGDFNSGSPSLIDSPVPDTFSKTSVQYYVPRIDVLYINKDKEVKITSGIPGDIPVRPQSPDSSIEVALIFVPSYTNSVSDILIRSLRNFRYTMTDIKKLEDRISSVEYYSTLTSVETSLVSNNIIDADTGINRFKSGYLVDNFDVATAICDFYNIDNRCSFFRKTLSAPLEDHETNMVLLDTSTNYVKTGNQVSLPYTETPLISQNTSTRVSNLNPFMVFSWEGMMTINPSFDSWIETQDLPTIFNTTSETITVKVPVSTPCPVPPSVGGGDVDPPTPVSPPESNATLSAYARDLGLSSPGSANWNDKVSFTVPQSVYNQTIGAVEANANTNFTAEGGGWQYTSTWINAIDSLNLAYNSAVTSSSADTRLYTPDQIVSYHQNH